MEGLLVHAGAVGDFVMALRVVEAMRQAGAGDVTVLGRPEIASVALGGGGVGKVLDIDGGGFHALFSPDAPFPKPAREALRGIGLAVDILGGPGSTVTARLGESGIPRVVSIDPRHRPDWNRHISDQWLEDLAKAGVSAEPGSPRIRVSEVRRHEARRSVLGKLAASEKRLVIMHPGSGSRLKCWPLDDYVFVARTLIDAGYSAAFLVGPVEVERFSVAEMATLRATAPLLGNYALPDAAAMLASADLYIGNDNGMSHVAAAVGVPTIAIFGPTDARVWRPLGENVACLTPGEAKGWPSRDAVLGAIKEFGRTG